MNAHIFSCIPSFDTLTTKGLYVLLRRKCESHLNLLIFSAGSMDDFVTIPSSWIVTDEAQAGNQAGDPEIQVVVIISQGELFLTNWTCHRLPCGMSGSSLE